MKKIFLSAMVALVALAACNNRGGSYTKLEKGAEFKIIGGGSGDNIKQGQFIQYSMNKYYEDSLLADGTLTGYVINPVDSAMMGPYFKMISPLRKGDSVVMRVMTDSIFKDQPGPMPDFMKKGKYLYTTMKVINIFKTQQEADAANQAEVQRMTAVLAAKEKEMAAKDEKTLQDYFSKNNVKTVKTPMGAYVEILQPGTGANIDTNVVASLKYTGRVLNNAKAFDSNVDPSFKHTDPLNVNMTTDMSLGTNVIPGLNDALKQMNKGTKAKVYIPSTLGYGVQGAGENIPPNSILVFDVEVADVFDRKAAAGIAAAERQKMMQMQQKMMDSMRAATPQGK